jgi:hypothetical protein
METSGLGEYWLTRFLFQRALGIVYLVAFLIAFFQFRALCGEHGILPVPLFLKRIRFWEAPSLFWLSPTDRAFALAAALGIALSLLTLTGLSDRFGIWVSVAVWGLLWLLYLSFVNVGQTFYGFGWETLLLEIGFLAIFLGSSDTAPPQVVIWLLRWVLFRVMFGAGLIKLRGDACWRDLTCLFWHYETQPLPNPLSWYFHRLPPVLHKGSVLWTHFVELAAPWGVFAPGLLGYLAGGLNIIFQISLILSGNLSWLNYVTLVVCIPCFDDAFLSRFIPFGASETVPMSGARQGVLAALTIFIVLLSIQPTLNLLSPGQIMNTSFEPLHLVNTYGAFGSVTKKRFEVIVEGTDEAVPAPYARWKAYEFKGKPGNLARPPCVVSPYHWKLDWQMWFAAMTPYYYHPWFLNLAAKLLQGDRDTLKLLADNPFPDHPPRFVRAELYEYHFTTPEERRQTGHWWKRSPAGPYLRPVSLEDRTFREVLQEAGWL